MRKRGLERVDLSCRRDRRREEKQQEEEAEEERGRLLGLLQLLPLGEVLLFKRRGRLQMPMQATTGGVRTRAAATMTRTRGLFTGGMPRTMVMVWTTE
jgi:hypothetical protein